MTRFSTRHSPRGRLNWASREFNATSDHAVDYPPDGKAGNELRKASGEWCIAAIYENRSGPEHLLVLGAHFPSKPESLRTNIRLATLTGGKGGIR
jgi:hypothetical protein